MAYVVAATGSAQWTTAPTYVAQTGTNPFAVSGTYPGFVPLNGHMELMVTKGPMQSMPYITAIGPAEYKFAAVDAQLRTDADEDSLVQNYTNGCYKPAITTGGDSFGNYYKNILASNQGMAAYVPAKPYALGGVAQTLSKNIARTTTNGFGFLMDSYAPMIIVVNNDSAAISVEVMVEQVIAVQIDESSADAEEFNSHHTSAAPLQAFELYRGLHGGVSNIQDVKASLVACRIDALQRTGSTRHPNPIVTAAAATILKGLKGELSAGSTTISNLASGQFTSRKVPPANPNQRSAAAAFIQSAASTINTASGDKQTAGVIAADIGGMAVRGGEVLAEATENLPVIGPVMKMADGFLKTHESGVASVVNTASSFLRGLFS
jgi:hypothetical protein